MIAILVSIVAAIVVGLSLIAYGERCYTMTGALSHFAGFVILLVAGASSLLYPILLWDWVSSEHKAKIINREYGTKYTREEVFYAENVIDTIREIDRQRIEVNGNILSEKRVDE